VSVALVLGRGGVSSDALDRLVDAARAGAAGFVDVSTPNDVFAADAVLVASPVVLYGLPGELKAFIDSWMDGFDAPKAANMLAGYVAVCSPDDEERLQAFHVQMRGIFSTFGMTYCGKAVGTQVGVARRLGQVLAQGDGFAGYPDAYLAGIAHYNAGEFWEAHEDWEDIWNEEASDLRLYYQGLIQVAAALHHFGHGNWSGMNKLLKAGTEKLECFRPRAMGLDLDAFLEELAPWCALAAARTGAHVPVLRVPDEPPRITVDQEG